MTIESAIPFLGPLLAVLFVWRAYTRKRFRLFWGISAALLLACALAVGYAHAVTSVEADGTLNEPFWLIALATMTASAVIVIAALVASYQLYCYIQRPLPRHE